MNTESAISEEYMADGMGEEEGGEGGGGSLPHLSLSSLSLSLSSLSLATSGGGGGGAVAGGAPDPKNGMLMSADAEIRRAVQTLREMLIDRGHPEDALAPLGAEAVVQKCQLATVAEVDLPACKIRIIFNLNVKYRSGDIKKLHRPPPSFGGGEEDEGGWQFIIVTREMPTQTKAVENDRENTQLFRLKELMFNVSHHTLVPRHIPIRDKAEIAKVLERWYVKALNQLPVILASDPMARYLALRPGELVRIDRPSPSAGTYQTYRCCQ